MSPAFVSGASHSRLRLHGWILLESSQPPMPTINAYPHAYQPHHQWQTWLTTFISLCSHGSRDSAWTRQPIAPALLDLPTRPQKHHAGKEDIIPKCSLYIWPYWALPGSAPRLHILWMLSYYYSSFLYNSYASGLRCRDGLLLPLRHHPDIPFHSQRLLATKILLLKCKQMVLSS